MTRLELIADLVALTYTKPFEPLAVWPVHGDGWLVREACDEVFKLLGWIGFNDARRHGTPAGNTHVNEALRCLVGWEYLVFYECCRSKGTSATQASIQAAILRELRPLPRESIQAFVAWLQMAPRSVGVRSVSLAHARLFARSLSEQARGNESGRPRAELKELTEENDDDEREGEAEGGLDDAHRAE